MLNRQSPAEPCETLSLDRYEEGMSEPERKPVAWRWRTHGQWRYQSSDAGIPENIIVKVQPLYADPILALPLYSRRELLKKLEDALTKDSLTDAERIADALPVLRREFHHD